MRFSLGKVTLNPILFEDHGAASLAGMIRVSRVLADNVANNLTVDIRQTEIPTGVTEREPFVVDT